LPEGENERILRPSSECRERKGFRVADGVTMGDTLLVVTADRDQGETS
jgi:hypothetical protein